MNKINVYQISPNQSDITSFFRGIGPYGRLAQSHKDLDIRFGEKMDIASIFWCDVFVMQRPFTPEHLNWIQTAKQLGKPVLIDYDDDVTHVPTHNPHQVHYNNPQVQYAIKTSLEIADVVTVSTQTLKDEFSQYSSKVIVVPNALDTGLISNPEIDWDKRNRMILWRGGESHTKDLIDHSTQLVNLTKANPQWLFEFFGGDEKYMNYILKPMLNQTNTHFGKTQSMLQYIKTLRQMMAPIMIVPLEDDAFNRSKSNIAWIEGTMNGSVVIAPNTPSWQAPGIVNYTDTADFEFKTNHLINNPGLWKPLWTQSFNYIKANLTLDKINRQRYIAIKGLV